MSSPTVSKPTFEHHHSGLGLSQPKPRVSWQFSTGSNQEPVADWIQTAYELELTSPSTGKVNVYHADSEQSVLVPWPAAALSSRECVTVRWTEWGESAIAEVALLHRSDWKASFVTSSQRFGDGPLQPVRFRKDFAIPPEFTSAFKARLYITSLGVHDAYINGKPVSDVCFAPGWTSYKHRLNYSVYDVTSLLSTEGTNTISAEVGEGWYATRLGFKAGRRFCYGDELAVMAQLEIASPNSTDTFGVFSDGSWLCGPSSIQSSELYDGEVIDMRQEYLDWNSIGAAGMSGKTKILPWTSAALVSPDAPPVRVTESRSPVEIFFSKSGKVIVDFGQNLVGKLQVKSVLLPKGAHLSFKHAEVMEHGELGVRPLRFAKATDTIIGSGERITDWTPRFTFHGFRYVQVDGWPSVSGQPQKEDLSALVMHSDLKHRGFFNCSNGSVNQLHKNIVWSMRGNFLSIPTDCPQRDERLGWTGDIQVFCPSANYLFDTTGMLGNWLEDVAAEQLEDGRGGIPPLVVPDVLPRNWPHIPQAVWDDVTILTPNDLYQYSADTELLRRQFVSMQTWLDNGVDRGDDGLWNPEQWQLSDWLDPAAPPDDPGSSRTDDVLVADAYLVHVTKVFAHICEKLGKRSLSAKYAADSAKLKTQFQHKYITPYGNLMSNSQTGVALAIQFDLYATTEHRTVAANSLCKLVRRARFNIATGFAGTPAILHALTTVKLPQIAYRMLLEKSCPSWLYPVTMGATTIWERWNSMLPDGTINPGQMTSFNHYALGAVADWLHGSVGGISPLEPGWKVVKVRPVPGGNVTSAEVSFDGPYGVVSCSWKLEGNDHFTMTLVVPPNSTAVVTLPSEISNSVSDEDEPSRQVGSGRHHFMCSYVAVAWPPKAIVAANQPPADEDIAI
ncbi:glycoside hydrolase family 78 protein [Hyaloscypha variabilis F]|uniref:alpha-L-rhamnosidase n=1 Tax=Hyaloscypha variabilis (strain UAMH 11265 / GT02V1 / F) TaxID=1149755 RepID=A0A2J6QSN1_HYAVF|nr:glycoside hydrolase family 78 protein [Hyaloscypha variabilis F]